MADLSLDIEGLDETLEELDRFEERWTGGGSWLVGTAVEYSIFLEYGTSKMDPKPFMRPALHAYQSNLRKAIAADTETTIEEIDSANELVRVIAFGLERRIKRIITEKGLIDTGTLRVSVMAVPGTDLGQLPSEGEIDLDEEGSAIDPRASADFEVNA